MLEKLMEIPTTGATCLCDALIGSKKVRLGNFPCEENYKYLSDLLYSFVKNGEPIQSFTMWGGLKAYGLFDVQGPDLLDVMALRRLKSIRAAVEKFYEPGITFRVLREDVTEYLLSDSVIGISEKMDTYHQGLKALAEALGIDIKFENESSTVELCSHICRAKTFAKLILDVVHQRVGAEALAEVGWIGGIPEIQWQHYVKRMESELPDATPEKRMVYVALYLGNALARRANGKVQGGEEIKISLMAHPPGLGQEMYKGRLEYKIKDDKNNHKSIPPWAGFGILDKEAWHQVGVKDFKAVRTEREEVFVNGAKVQLLRVV